MRWRVAALLLGLVLGAGPAWAQWPAKLTDALGREVVLPAPPKAIILAEGFQLLTLSLLHPDPVSLLAGWGEDLRRLDPPTYEAYLKRFPALARVPFVGAGNMATASMEQVLSLKPDLAIFSTWQATDGNTRQMVENLQSIGVPVLFIDFFEHPLAGTPAALRLLGRVLDRQAQAEALASLYESHLAHLRARMEGAPPGPSVLMHAFPGRFPCCWTSGSGAMGEFLSLLGARNLGAPLGTRTVGQLSLEQVISQDPDVYIATGRSRAVEPGSLSLGVGIPAEEARRSLAQVALTPGLSELSAMQRGRVHGLWNFFNVLPLNIVALEAMARWIRPELFGDLDAEATLHEINTRFAALPFEGTYWTSLPPR